MSTMSRRCGCSSSSRVGNPQSDSSHLVLFLTALSLARSLYSPKRRNARRRKRNYSLRHSTTRGVHIQISRLLLSSFRSEKLTDWKSSNHFHNILDMGCCADRPQRSAPGSTGSGRNKPLLLLLALPRTTHSNASVE